MKRSDFLPHRIQHAASCALVIGIIGVTCESDAAKVVGGAYATVVEPVSVSIVAAPLPGAKGTAPALSGTVFTLESFTTSVSVGGPLLRSGSPPNASGSAAAAGSAAGPASAPAGSASDSVQVTRHADGSFGVSAGSGLTFAVSRPAAGALSIDYN